MDPIRRNTPSQVRDVSNQMRDMFATKSHSWEEAGLTRQISQKEARRARRQVIAVVPLLTAVLLGYVYREDLFGKGTDREVRIATVVLLVILGWALARDIGRAAGPSLFRRMDPGTAGTFGFIIRLATVGVTLLIALRIAGLDPRALAVGGAFTAVIVGLAAQQTLGNLIAGTVLLSARPFRVGERVRLEGGGMSVEGVVSSLGLLYTILADGEDTIMVPNSIVLSQAVTPLREPDSVDLRARLQTGVKPSDVQALLEQRVSVPTRSVPSIFLEEVDGDEVVVRIRATPHWPPTARSSPTRSCSRSTTSPRATWRRRATPTCRVRAMDRIQTDRFRRPPGRRTTIGSGGDAPLRLPVMYWTDQEAGRS